MYENNIVPVVDKKTDQRISEGNLYVNLFSQNESQANTKCYFAANADMVIDIVHRTTSSISTKVLDTVANEILQLLFPTRHSTALTLDAPFSLSYARFERSELSPVEQINYGFVQVKSIIFSNRVIQPT